jgi:long-chain fatty acid transport protein
MVKFGSVAVLALVASASSAFAGGFAVREQSTESQGASFAGSAAFGGLSSMFWNPAAAANKDGFNTESNYAFIKADAQIHTKTGTSSLLQGSNDSGNIAGTALVPASYLSYQMKQIDPNLYLGVGLNSPFGLTTEPENGNYKGAVLGRTTKLFTLNLNPNLAYKVSNTLTVGAGLNLMYASGAFKFETFSPLAPSQTPSTGFEGTGTGIGVTAGLMYTPAAGTTIGLGYKSRMTEKLDGTFFTNASGLTGGAALATSASTEVKLPDIITLSFKQAVTNDVRLLGTFEWSNWSRFNELRVTATNGGGTVFGAKAPGSTIAVIDAKWANSYFLSLGGEYDVSRSLTLRTGAAYEKSPVDDPTKKLSGIPDADRIWGSIGASYKWSDSTTLDFAYTHIFLKDGELNRTSLSGYKVVADTEAKTDILSVGMKHRW